eukprot:scaffold24018_cov69-Phaeocystis_antarctica.AAC.4
MHAEAFIWQGKGHAEATNVRTARGRFFWHVAVLLVGAAWWPFHVRTGTGAGSSEVWKHGRPEGTSGVQGVWWQGSEAPPHFLALQLV